MTIYFLLTYILNFWYIVLLQLRLVHCSISMTKQQTTIGINMTRRMILLMLIFFNNLVMSTNRTIICDTSANKEHSTTRPMTVRIFPYSSSYFSHFLVSYLDETFDSPSNRVSSNPVKASSIPIRRMSPSSAVRSIMSSYTKDENTPPSSTTTKTTSRVRAQRKFGEVITSGTLLDELKEKAEMKKIKELKRKKHSQSRKSSNN